MDPQDESSSVHPSSTTEVSIPFGMANIRDDQAMARTVAAVARKRTDWTKRTSRVSPDKDFLVDKKQKWIADQL